MSNLISILGKIALLMQIVSLPLLQIYVLAPPSSLGFLNRADGAKRVFYHRCGCPPEKVASRTCCCYTGRCSPPAKQPAATCHSCSNLPSSPDLALLSGGCIEESYGISAGQVDLIGTSLLLENYRHVTLFVHAGQIIPENFLQAPPCPPPEITLPSL